MQSAKMSNLRHDCQIQPFYEHNWLGEEILYFIISAAMKLYNQVFDFSFKDIMFSFKLQIEQLNFFVPNFFFSLIIAS